MLRNGATLVPQGDDRVVKRLIVDLGEVFVEGRKDAPARQKQLEEVVWMGVVGKPVAKARVEVWRRRPSDNPEVMAWMRFRDQTSGFFHVVRVENEPSID